MTIGDFKDNLAGLLHGVNIDTINDLDLILQRASNTLLSKIDPIDTMRTAALSQTIHDDVFNYSLPSDYKKIIDLIPQDNRNSWDTAVRNPAGQFDLQKAVANKKISIEGSEGSKIARINWRTRQGKLLNAMDSVTANGTWIAVGTATGIQANTIFKKTGSASIEFDIVASGDGISNISMSTLDFTDEDEVADIFVWVYFGAVTNLTSISGIWGNDITTKYWTSTAQTTQADGRAFQVGWNLIKFSWSTATETGTVTPNSVDSFKITFATTGAISNVRVDNIMFSIGRNFDIKYYSKYLLKNSSGIWIPTFTSDSDIIVLDDDAVQILLEEALIASAQQIENAGFDISWAKTALNGDPTAVDPIERYGQYAKYRKEYPSQSKKAISRYGSNPIRSRRFEGRG